MLKLVIIILIIVLLSINIIWGKDKEENNKNIEKNNRELAISTDKESEDNKKHELINDDNTFLYEKIRYDLIFNEGNNVLFAAVDSQNYRTQLSDWDSITNAPKDVQIKANAVLFPQEKVQVINSFNEMLSRMNKTRNGSILL